MNIHIKPISFVDRCQSLEWEIVLNMKPITPSLWRNRNGQALVEFVLVVPLLSLFLFAIVQMGLLFNGFITIEQAARLGVRSASLGESPQQVGCAIYNQINSGVFPDNATINWTETPSTTASQPTVTVQVSTSYPLFLSVPGLGSAISISQQYTMVEESGSPTHSHSGSFSRLSPPTCP